MHAAAHPFLFAFAIGVAVVIAYAALDVGLRVSKVASRRNRPLWLLLATLTIASGMWSVQWLFMRSAEDSVHIAFDVRIGTLAWLLDGLLALLLLRSVPLAQATPAQRLWLALLSGLAMVLAYYASVLGMQLDPLPRFDAARLVASLLWPMLTTSIALESIRRGPEGSLLLRRLLPSLLIGGGLVGAHLLALSATQLAPDVRCIGGSPLGDVWLAVPVVFGLSTLIAASLTLTVADKHELVERERSQRDRQHAERVRRLAYYDRFTALPNRTLFNATLTKRLVGEGGERPAPFGLVYVHLADAQRALQQGAEPFAAWLRQQVVPLLPAHFGPAAQVFRYSLGGFMLLVPAETPMELATAVAALGTALPSTLPVGAGLAADWHLASAHFPSQGATAPALVLAVLPNKNADADEVRTGATGSAILTLA